MRSESAIKKAEAQNTEDKANNDKDSIYFGQGKQNNVITSMIIRYSENFISIFLMYSCS